eukprot:GDKI01045167.1.p1 GENE.GDKI01045167.1~~GDKI01045167.1.p1  ORF type:complete len:178 (-),score=24.55 GDKI01045167.1:31-564(-)
MSQRSGLVAPSGGHGDTVKSKEEQMDDGALKKDDMAMGLETATRRRKRTEEKVESSEREHRGGEGASAEHPVVKKVRLSCGKGGKRPAESGVSPCASTAADLHHTSKADGPHPVRMLEFRVTASHTADRNGWVWLVQFSDGAQKRMSHMQCRKVCPKLLIDFFAGRLTFRHRRQKGF